MKSITKSKIIIFCLILISLTASGSYAYFTWGELYVGQFKDGLMNGQGTMTYPNGRKEAGKWRNGEYIGR